MKIFNPKRIMKDLLRKLKLIDNFTTSINISKIEFIEKLTAITDKGNFGMFSDTFDAFSSNKKEFKGQIDFNGFTLKRRRRFFDNNGSFAVIIGNFYENDGQLTIKAEINGFHNFFLFFYIVLIIFYTTTIISTSISENVTKIFIIPFCFLHGAFMFSIPYFIMKRSVKRLKYELEREFFYLTKNK
jgi:hypothetical protein